MIDHSTEAVVLVHLSECDGFQDGRAPYEASIPGISDAVGATEGTLAERVSLLSTLRALEDEGLVEKRVLPVAARGIEGERNAYALTAAGEDRARRIREAAADETVVVENGESEELPLGEVDRVFDRGLVRALSELSDDGVIYLDDGAGDRFVNREAELDRFASALDAARGGDPRFAFVSGEAGVGKTTLLQAVEDRARDRGFEVATGRPDSTSGDPYGPLEAAFSGIQDGESVTDPLGGVDGPSPAGTSGTAPDPEAVDARRQAMRFAFRQRLRDLVADRPLVVFLDDLQWAPTGTLELLGYLARNLETGALLVVGAYRPEDLPPDHHLSGTIESIREDRLVEVELDRFDRSTTGEQVESQLETRSVPDHFVEALHEHTGGNPLFVEESVERLRDEGLVDPDLDVYPTDLPPDTVPEAVEATIDVRLGALDRRSREVLETGAVVGTTARIGLLSAVSDVPDPALRDRIDVLVGARIWERTGDGAVEFTSGVVRETVLDRLDDERRRGLHRSVAEAIVDGGDGASEGADLVAAHLDRAGERSRALDWYRRAAENAERVYAHRDAIRLYDRALELAREEDHEEATLDALQQLGRIHFVVGEFDEAVRHYEYVRDRTEDPETKRLMYHREAEILTSRGDYETAMARIEAGRDVPVDDDATEWRLLSTRGWIHHHQGAYDRAAAVFDRELTVAARTGEDEPLAKAHHDVGVGHLYTGDPGAAVEQFGTALEYWPPDDYRRADTCNNLGIAHRRMGDLDAAIDSYERALAISEEADHVRSQSVAISNLSVVYAQSGDLDRAIDYGERAREMAERIGDEMGVAKALGNLGKHHLNAGDPQAAREALVAARDRFERLGNDATLAMVDQSIGSAALQLDDPEAAIATLERGIEVARRADHDHALATNHLELSGALLEVGRGEAALDHVRTAADLAEDMERPETVVDARLKHGVVLRELDRLDEAIDRFRGATEAAEGLGNPVKTAEAHNQLGLALRDRGRAERAREQFERAMEVAEAHGLDDVVDAVAGELPDHSVDP